MITGCPKCGNPPDGTKSICKPCKSKYDKRRKSTPEGRAYNKAKMREWRRKYMESQRLAKYGITPEKYSKMMKEQDSRCAACRSEFSAGKGDGRRPMVDHCHETGKVRGILCFKCNVAEGLLGMDGILGLLNYLGRALP